MKQGYTQFGGEQSFVFAFWIQLTDFVQVFDHSVSHFSMLDGILCTASSSINQILRVTILDGKRLASAPTILRPRVCSSKITRRICL